MKTIFRITLALFVAASVFLTIVSISKNEWATSTASLSLIIAIISAWIAFEVFRNIEDRKLPSLTIIPDATSRYELIQLKLRNNGQNPAYSVRIDWNNYPISHKDEKVTFNKYRTGEYEALILNGDEETSVLVDTHSGFFKKHKDKNLTFSGTITYSLKMNSKRKLSTPFLFSLEHMGASLSYEHEEPKTNVELQKIPKKLDEIKNEIRKLGNS